MNSVLLQVQTDAKPARATLPSVLDGFIAEKDFIAECRRQSLALNGDVQEKDVLNWAESAYMDEWK